MHEIDRHERLLGRLRDVLHDSDPPPAHYLAFAKHALAVTRLDAEIGDFIASQRLTGVRSTSVGFVGTVQFSSFEVELDGIDGRLVGRVSPPRVIAVELQAPAGNKVTSTAADGFFAFDDLPTSRFRLVFGGERLFASAWMSATDQ